MKIKSHYLAAAMLMGAALSAFGQATVVANPNSFTFNLSAAGSVEQKLVLQLSTGVSTLLTVSGNYVLINGKVSDTVQTGAEVLIRPAPGATAGVPGSIGISGVGVTTASLPVTFTGTSTGGSTSFMVDKTTLNFSQAVGAAPPAGQAVNITSISGVVPNYSVTTTYASGTTTGWLSYQPYSNQLWVYPVNTAFLAAGTYTAYLQLTPVGATPVTITVNLIVGGSGTTGSFNATPNPINVTYLGGTVPQPVTVSVTTTPNASFTIVPSANLINLVTISPNATTASTLGTASFTVTPTTSATGAVSGSVILSGPTLLTTEVPLNLNSTSGGGTSAGLTYSPASLTFNIPLGSTAAPTPQTITIISADFTSKIFTTSVQTQNGLPFLTASQSGPSTPATVTVSVNPAALPTGTQATYTGGINLTPTFGGFGMATIPVTVNVGTGGGGGGGNTGTVFAEPSSVSLTAKAGDPLGPQALIELKAPGGADPGFLATVSTESGGNWLSVQPLAGSLLYRITVAADVRNLAAGTYKGSVLFATALGNTTVPVTLTVSGTGTLELSTKTLIFNHQLTNSTAPPAQTVQVAGTAGMNWSAMAKTTSGSGWLQVSPASGTTPGSASISVTPAGLTAGTYRGSVDITSGAATNSPQTVDVTLVVTSAPTPEIRTAVNAASFVAGPVSAGVILTITGADLGPATGVGAPAGATIPTTLGGVQVRFDGIAAPILYASATQLNVVVPFEVAGRPTTKIQVEYQNIRSRELELTVRDATPGLFTQNSSGSGPGAIVNQNGTVNTSANPEAAGNIVVVYATGFGQLVPAPASGSVVPGTGSIPRPVLPVRVKIGGVDSEVLYAGAAPGFVAGAIQVNVRIPAGTLTGNPPVQVQVGEQVSPNFVTVAVR